MLKEAKKAFQDGKKNKWSEDHYYGAEKISYMFGKSIGKIDGFPNTFPDAVESSISKNFLSDISEFRYRWRNASGVKSKLKILFSSVIPFTFAVLAFTPFYLYEEMNVFWHFHTENVAGKSLGDIFLDALSDTFHIMVPILQLFLIALFFKIVSIIMKKIP